MLARIPPPASIADPLLALLYADGRAPVEELASACGGSSSALSRRLSKLLSRGELTIGAFVHPALQGRPLTATLIAAVRDLPSDPVLQELAGLWRYDVAANGRMIAVQVRVADDHALAAATDALSALPEVIQVKTLRWSRTWRDGHLPLAPQPIPVTDQITQLLTALRDDGRATLPRLATMAAQETSTTAGLLSRLLDARVVAIRGIPKPGPLHRAHLIAVEPPGSGQLTSKLARLPEMHELADTSGPWPLIGQVNGPAAAITRLLNTLAARHHGIRHWPIARSRHHDPALRPARNLP